VDYFRKFVCTCAEGIELAKQSPSQQTRAPCIRESSRPLGLSSRHRPTIRLSAVACASLHDGDDAHYAALVRRALGPPEAAADGEGEGGAAGGEDAEREAGAAERRALLRALDTRDIPAIRAAMAGCAPGPPLPCPRHAPVPLLCEATALSPAPVRPWWFLSPRYADVAQGVQLQSAAFEVCPCSGLPQCPQHQHIVCPEETCDSHRRMVPCWGSW
jgi:hypothetical protein